MLADRDMRQQESFSSLLVESYRNENENYSNLDYSRAEMLLPDMQRSH